VSSGTIHVDKDFYHIEDVLVEPEIIGAMFACDLPRCKGACCTMESELGAPLLEPEIGALEKALPSVREYLPRDSARALEEWGFWEPKGGVSRVRCLNRRDCVFVYYEGDIARCGIERAYREGKIDFIKPLSCHLFPMRIFGGKGPVLRFEHYHECGPAMIKGRKEHILLVDFCRDALTRAFGEGWLSKMKKALNG